MKKNPFAALPLSDIPNTKGFKLVVETKTGKKVSAEVDKREDGTHYLPGWEMKDLAGWHHLPKRDNALSRHE